MKLTQAEFRFEDKTLGDVRVKFEDSLVTVCHGVDRFEIKNEPRKWGGVEYKPCVSHCLQAIRRATYKPPVTNQEKRKLAKTKPALRVAHIT